ncbi:MAG: phytoene/squalene synthase family protein [Bryobacteraceae bacterium]|nr:phytoene/squalene synthase family protein [Bryobacteraceae bacterium]
MTAVEQSYRFCERVARRRARNFYYSFLALPRHKRRAMCALYAFMRECDDLSDGARASLEALRAWRTQLDEALAGGAPPHALWPAFMDTVHRYRIPPECLYGMIEGVASDFEPRLFDTFDALYRYCYLVASVVGIATIHVFGFADPRAPRLAERCGIAFQLTNILRDVGEDARSGRIYLPREDMERFGVTAEMLSAPAVCAELQRLLAFEAARARAYYEEAEPLIGMVEPDSRHALWALIEIYRRLLGRIEQRGYEVLASRVRLSPLEKTAIALRAMLARRG